MARTSKEVTQSEIDKFRTWATTEGIELSKDNLQVAVDFIAGKMNSDISETSLVAAYPYVKTLFKFKSLALRTFEKLVSQITASEAEVFEKWFYRQKRLLNDDSDEALQNATNILTWATAHGGINERNFDLATTNLPAKGIQVHYRPVPVDTTPLGRHSGRKFDYSSNTSVAGEVGRIDKHNYANDAEYQPKPVVEQLTSDEARWKSLAEGLRGHHHSTNAQLDAVTGTSWRNVYEQRLAIIRRSERVGR
jgi:hypothetical protein